MARPVYLTGDEKRAQLVELWQLVFGDTSSYIESFYSAFEGGMDVVVMLDGQGQPVSAAHFLPVTMKIGKSTVKGSYLYAAMTHPAHRGKALMGQILVNRLHRGLDAGELFMCTLPASESLYGLYERYGFGPAFTLRRAALSREELSAIKRAPPFESNVSPEFAYRPSYGAREFTVIKNRLFVDYTASDNAGVGGRFLPFGGGYMYVRPGIDGIYVKELWADGESMPYAAAMLLRRYPDCARFVFDLCADSHLAPAAKPVQSGALRIINAPAFLRLCAGRHPDETYAFNLTDDTIDSNNGGYRLRNGRVVWGDRIEDAPECDIAHLAVAAASDNGRFSPYMNMMLD